MEQNTEKEKFRKVQLSWYPGHMAKTKKQIIEDLKLVDIIIEILDARIPISSQNPDIQNYIKGKKKIEVLNKSDLADERQTLNWIKYFEKNNIPAAITDSSSGVGIREVIKKIETVYKEDKNKYEEKGRTGKSIRVLVLGIPNVGKSSFINRISKKASAKVGNKPGVTKQKQWIRLNDGIELLDTPGVLWPKFDNELIAMNLAYTGTIKDDILEKTEVAYSLLKYMMHNYKENLLNRYKLENNDIEDIINSSSDMDENDKYLEIFELIGRKRGLIISGGKVDYEKVSNVLLDEFRSGKLGRITLEKL